VRLTLVTHSTVAMDVGDATLLTDPVLRGHVAFLRRTVPPPDPRLLRNVRAVLVSHLHHDHCDPASLSLLPRSLTLLVPAGAETFFRRRGFDDVRPMRPGERHRLEGIDVTAVEAAHDGTRRPFGSASLSIGFVIDASGVSAYFAGDTDLFEGMRGLRPGLDVALVPVAGWGRALGPGHLDARRAAQAVAMLAPSIAIPMHWDGLRPAWHRRRPATEALAAPRAFAEAVAQLGLPTRVEILRAGQSLVVEPAG
jgi:L-ascorbate metabolism protein UlaG (beta-lactamase superfamily)